MTTRTVSLAAALLAVAGSACSAPSAPPLRNPLASSAVGQRSTIAAPRADCPIVPPVAGVAGVGYYTDLAASRIDPSRIAANRRAALPINNFASQVRVQTERYLSSGRRDVAGAACALAILDGWAKANALGGSFNEQGLAQRRWVVNGVAVDFLAIRDAGLDPAAIARVARWLDGQGRAIVATIGDKKNNHLYWAAAAVIATSIAANDRAGFEWAISAARRGIDEIEPSGALPQERRRGAMAMHYHVFALEPLVQVAGFASMNGVDLYGADDGAIRRLAHLVLANIANPAGIQRLVGLPQTFTEKPTDALSWTEQYYADTGDCAAARAIAGARPLAKAYLGGSTTLLYGGRPLGRCR